MFSNFGSLPGNLPPTPTPNSPGVDAFGRLRVSNNYTLFDGQFRYGINPLVWNSLVASNGTLTYNSATNDVTFACTDDTGSRALLEGPYLRYQPGKSNLIKVTTNPNATGETFRLVVRKNGSDANAKSQNDFNRDKVNGFGKSAFYLDPAKSQIFSFDFQHLGVGIIRFCVEKENGETILIDTFENPNNMSEMYMYTAQLPFRCEIYNDGIYTYKRFGYFDNNNGIFFEFRQPEGPANFKLFCCSVETENGVGLDDEFGLFFGRSNGIAGKSISTTLVPVISVRPKLLFNGKTNRAITAPTDFSLLSSARDVRVVLCLNPVLTGATFALSDPNSTSEADIAATAFTSTGTILREFFFESSQSIALSKNLIGRLTLGLDVEGTNADIFTLGAQTLTTTSTLNAALGWKEFQ